MADSRTTDARRQALIDAAGQVFIERGFEAATTLEIAREAKTSKRAIYEMFGSKEELLEAVVADTSGRMVGPADLPVPRDWPSFAAALTAFGEAFLTQLFEEHRIAFYRLAVADAQRGGTLARSIEEKGRAPVAEALMQLITAAVMNGVVRISDAELVSLVFISMLFGETHVRLLIGALPAPGAAEIAERVGLAVEAVRRVAGH